MVHGGGFLFLSKVLYFVCSWPSVISLPRHWWMVLLRCIHHYQNAVRRTDMANNGASSFVTLVQSPLTQEQVDN